MRLIMFNPNKYKFINEFPQFKDLLMVDSLDEFFNKLTKIKKGVSGEDYNNIAGFSFEYIVGCVLHLYGGMKQFGVMDYTPTYVGDNENPDHGADGFGRAFIPNSTKTRLAIVQIKFRANPTDNLYEFGNLPAVVGTRLCYEDEVNVTFITTSKETKGSSENLEHENSSMYLAKKFKERFSESLQERIFVRIIQRNQLVRELDNFHIWQKIREMSGLFI